MKQHYPAWHLYSGRAYVPAVATDIRKTIARARAMSQSKDKVVVQLNTRKPNAK